MKSLPQKLQSWRRRAKLSQNAAAARLNVNLRTYQQWEQARHAPRGLALVTLQQLIKP